MIDGMSTDSSEKGEQIEPDLDWKGRAILQAIHENGGTANTSKIKEFTGISDNDKILYQYHNKLTPSGLIKLEQPKSNTGRPAPKVASFTQRGVKVAEQVIDEHSGDNSLESRVDKFEADISRLESEIDTVESTDIDLEELQVKTDNLLYQVGLIADFLNKQHDGRLSEYRKQREQETER